MSKEKKQAVNLLDLHPQRLMEHQLDDGVVTVMIPRFRSRWLTWLQKRQKRPYIKLRLDDVGSAVWLDCDGHMTVSEIGQRLLSRFGEDVEPVWDRLSLFITHMCRGQLIDLR